MIGRGRLCAGVAVAAMALGSCSSDPRSGYSFSPVHRTDIHTVSVPIFENQTFSHGLEFALTDAVIKEIHRVTPWRVVKGEQAETTLSGTITGKELRRLSRGSQTGLVQEVAVEMTVSFEWKRNGTGEVLAARRNFRSADVFTPANPVKERLALGEAAAIDVLARDIVAELRSSW